MNLLGLIFSILVTLSIAFCTLFEKQIGGARLRSSYLGHAKATRGILNSYESKVFHDLPGKLLRNPSQNTSSPQELKEHPFPKNNPPCARLNLWPLTQEGKEAHPLLYQMAAELFRSFYGHALLDHGSEYAFLDTLLKALHEHPGVALEKLPFSHPAYRKLYYQMLKGTKTCDLFCKNGYPSLLEYISVDQGASKPCLFHAHPYLTSVFFGPRVACKLHDSVHRKNGEKLTPDYIRGLCSEARIFLHPDIFSLVETKSCRQKAHSNVFTGADNATQISLRKEIPFEREENL